MIEKKIRDKYRAWNVDVEAALQKLQAFSISIQCWQGDDVSGFEKSNAALSGGIMVTGSHPGPATTPQQLQEDFLKALQYIPGNHRINLHAMYGQSETFVDRDAIKPEHFDAWIAFAKENNLGIDFNPTFFSHPKATSFTLTHPDPKIREFWIEHGRRSREIAAYIGEALGTPVVNNLWIPDGFKNTPANRLVVRQRLKESLDAIYKEPYSKAVLIDTLESKVFGIGLESFTVGSSEFYLNYCMKQGKMPLMDTGHYHQGEYVSEKISALLPFFDAIALHISRPVRWDSDHVVNLDDELIEICKEIVASDALSRVHVALDFFDASVNRIAAWILGVRNVQKAMLYALLLPHETLLKYQEEGRYTELMVLLEEFKSYPWQAIWEAFCESNQVPSDASWLEAVLDYEAQILKDRIKV